MKLYILVFLAVLSYVSATEPHPATFKAEDKEKYVLATVLFYCNGIGDKVVAAGKVPTKVKWIIRYKLQQIYKNTDVKVVPIYRNYEDVPIMDQVYTEIRNKHTTVLFSTIPEELSTWLVGQKLKHFKEQGNLSGVEHFPRKYFENKNDVRDKEVESNIISGKKKQNTKFVPYGFEKGVRLEATYLPNTVYYTTQIKLRKNGKMIETFLKMVK